jgi:hypothetical protein
MNPQERTQWLMAIQAQTAAQVTKDIGAKDWNAICNLQLAYHDSMKDISSYLMKIAQDGKYNERLITSAIQRSNVFAGLDKITRNQYRNVTANVTQSMKQICGQGWNGLNETLDAAVAGGKVAVSLGKIPTTAVNAILSFPYKGEMFSERLGEVSSQQALGIQRSLVNSIIEGESIDTAANRIIQKVMPMSQNRAVIIARTEMARADSMAREAWIKVNGKYLKGRQYWAAPDELTCRTCAGYDGREWPIEATDFPLTPVHPCCRCQWFFVFKTPEEIAATMGQKYQAWKGDSSAVSTALNKAQTSWTNWFRSQPAELRDNLLAKGFVVPGMQEAIPVHATEEWRATLTDTEGKIRDNLSLDIKDEYMKTYTDFMDDKTEKSHEMWRKMEDKYKLSREEILQKVEDARQHILTSPSTTSLYRDLGGVYTPEREALHQQILDEFFSNRGKLVIDSDEFKTMLVRADRAELSLNASVYHSESADILNQAVQRAIKEGRDIVIDGTMSGTQRYSEMLAEFVKKGWNTEMAFVDTPMDESMGNALSRFLSGGRFVDPLLTASEDGLNLATYEAMKNGVEKTTMWSGGFWKQAVFDGSNDGSFVVNMNSKPTVLFTGGFPGAGKSSALESAMKDIRDLNHQDLVGSFVKLIQEKPEGPQIFKWLADPEQQAASMAKWNNKDRAILEAAAQKYGGIINMKDADTAANFISRFSPIFDDATPDDWGWLREQYMDRFGTTKDARLLKDCMQAWSVDSGSSGGNLMQALVNRAQGLDVETNIRFGGDAKGISSWLGAYAQNDTGFVDNKSMVKWMEEKIGGVSPEDSFKAWTAFNQQAERVVTGGKVKTLYRGVNGNAAIRELLGGENPIGAAGNIWNTASHFVGGSSPGTVSEKLAQFLAKNPFDASEMADARNLLTEPLSIPFGPLQSWSMDSHTARGFGTKVIASKVTWADSFAFDISDPALTGEYEWLLLKPLDYKPEFTFTQFANWAKENGFMAKFQQGGF